MLAYHSQHRTRFFYHYRANTLTYHFVFLLAESNALWALVHIQIGPHSMPSAVVVVQTVLPQRQTCNAIEARPKRAFRKH